MKDKKGSVNLKGSGNYPIRAAKGMKRKRNEKESGQLKRLIGHHQVNQHSHYKVPEGEEREKGGKKSCLEK